MRLSEKTFGFFNYVFFTAVALTMLYPFWYVIMFSLSAPSIAAVNNYYLKPSGFSLVAYKYILTQQKIYYGFRNSLFVTIVGTALNLFFTSITAYPLSRERLPGKKIIFTLIFFTMIFGGGMIPTYLVVRTFGLVNTLWALIVPSLIAVFNMMILMKFFKSIPDSLIECAKIDGYNDIMILFTIVIPLSTAALAAIGLFYAVRHWNDFLHAIIYINDKEKMVLQVILRNMFLDEDLGRNTRVSMQISTPEHFRMATIIIVMFPILCVYPFLQKHFTKGVMLGSVKG